ncbi:MAG: gamma-glutamyltranspeptidase / glutathione hydrolase [Gaiellales bacterium]|nr:gamma-glutamyltranspeptidase / glutathione hydrolase [Gaiellales bacterium]
MHTQSDVLSERGVVSAGHPDEADAGVRALSEGGNAMDAVVASAFVGFVVEPASCGPGGYGHLAAFMPAGGGFVTVDHGPRVPAGARPDMFEIEQGGTPLYYGWPATVGRRNEFGHSAVAVPGAVAGLCAAHERWGRLPLAQLLEPAIEAAERGLDVSWNLVLFLNERLAEIRQLPRTAELLLRDGDLPRPPGWGGVRDRIDLSELAGTLRLIAREGAAGIYDGAIARAIEHEVCGHGGILTAADLRAYEPRILTEQPGRYRGHDYVTAFDQLGYEALNILEHFDLAGLGADSLGFRHLTAEALAAAFTDNGAWFGDPDVVESPVRGLSSREFGAFRAAGISLERALPRPVAAADPRPFEGGPAPARLPYRGTTQMAAADADGNVVSLITSLTHSFGSLVLVPGTGILLNNSMVNYDPRPGRPNSIAPGKLPIFAAPALVAARDGEAVFGSCGSGGYRILSGVLHSALNAFDHGMHVQAAIDAPRVHCQGGRTLVDARIPVDVIQGLRDLGHEVDIVSDDPGVTQFGRISAVSRDPQSGLLRAGSGPAWWTASAGV